VDQPRVRIWAFIYPSALQEVLEALTSRTRYGMLDWVIVPLPRGRQADFVVPAVSPSD